MQLAELSRLTVFPPARWENDSATVDIGALGCRRPGPLADHDLDELERSLRALMARRAPPQVRLAATA